MELKISFITDSIDWTEDEFNKKANIDKSITLSESEVIELIRDYYTLEDGKFVHEIENIEYNDMTATEAKNLKTLAIDESLAEIFEKIKYNATYNVDKSKIYWFVSNYNEISEDQTNRLKELGYEVTFELNEDAPQGPYYEISWE